MRKKLTLEEKKIVAENKDKFNAETALALELKVLLGNKYIPEPTRFFKPGERVVFGAHEDVTIVEVLDNHKIYKLQIIFKGSRSYMYRPWTDIYPYRTKAENDLLPTLFEDNIMDRINFSNRSLDGLILSYYHFRIDMNPAYQREFVWTHEEKVKLIDSIFKHVDIGKFVLIEKPFKDGDYHYEILDVKQHLRAILDFYEGRLRYKDKTYCDLHYHDMSTFDNMNISMAISPPIKEVEKYMYFLRLNTGGRVQDPKHLANVESMLYNASTKK